MIVYCSKCETGNDGSKSVCQACGHPLGAADHPEPAEYSKKFVVTTGDLHCDYCIIGPVFFQVSYSETEPERFPLLKEEYGKEIAAMRKKEHRSGIPADFDLWSLRMGVWSLGQTDFELAFFMAVEELKKTARMLEADAIIGMRQDIAPIAMYTSFYLRMYGTAVKTAGCAGQAV